MNVPEETVSDNKRECIEGLLGGVCPEPEAALPPYEGNDSAYRFMEGTPFSIFYNSMRTPARIKGYE